MNLLSFLMKTHFAFAFASLLAASMPSNATTLLYDGFDYPVGSALDGQSGGVGFAEAWIESTSDKDTIQSGSLSFAGVTTSGASVRSVAPSNEFYTNIYRKITSISA